MDQLRKYHVVEMSGTTDASGDAVVNSGETNLVGQVEMVLVEGSAMTDTADLDVHAVYIGADGSTEFTDEIVNHEDAGPATLLPIYPRGFEHDAAGADITVATSTKVTRRFALAGCSLRVTVANGGNTKAFKVWVLVEV